LHHFGKKFPRSPRSFLGQPVPEKIFFRGMPL
jgi:hypothetical protein